MTRSNFRRFWLITLALMVGSFMYAHGEYEDLLSSIRSKTKEVDRLTAERRSGSQLTASLADLDSRTFNEKDSTRLDLLRYLGVEESRLKIDFSSPKVARVGTSSLTVRGVNITGILPYEEALSQLDYFYNTKKVAIKSVSVNSLGRDSFGDAVSFVLKGEIYAVRK